MIGIMWGLIMGKLNQDQELMDSILAKEWHALYAEEIILVMNYAKEQQAKIDELKKTRSLDEMAINQLAQANQVWRTKCDDLENRIHDAELQIAVHWGADEDTDSVLRDVEKALRGAND